MFFVVERVIENIFDIEEHFNRFCCLRFSSFLMLIMSSQRKCYIFLIVFNMFGFFNCSSHENLKIIIFIPNNHQLNKSK